MTTTQKHNIKWFVYAGSEKIPHTATMRGLWGYDAECSCGWSTKTGGAVRTYVKARVWEHKYIDPDGPQLSLTPRKTR